MVDKELLNRSLLFKNLSPEDQATVAAACEVVSVDAGGYIYKRDTEGDYFYVVLEGEVELVAPKDDNSTCMVGRIGEGGHFGEGSLLTGQTRSVSMRAVFWLFILICSWPAPGGWYRFSCRFSGWFRLKLAIGC